MRRPVAIFFDQDRGMVFFLSFLVLLTLSFPLVNEARVGRVALALVFAFTVISGAFVTIQHRVFRALVIALSLSTVAVDLTAEFYSHIGYEVPAFRLASLSILVVLTVRRTFRPGAVTVYRVMGGIAGYLLIGFTWAFAYQLVVDYAPSAIHFVSGLADTPSEQPVELVYFSFITLTTVGYGDAYPVNPVARSLAMSEALIGQIYVATLIGWLVGMALQRRISDKIQG